jgi:hypothetical protein
MFLIKSTSEIRTIFITKRSNFGPFQNWTYFSGFRMAKTIRKLDHSASGQELNPLKPDGPDFGL